MHQNTLDNIRSLTATDKKSLTQKTLKAVEEVGELAKVVLPYENAYATVHRFVEKSRILEEVSDVLLTVISIAYELGYTDDDIDSMVNRKMAKWRELQNREANLKYPVPFEIHITVREANVEGFKDVCRKIGVKPILLDLHRGDGSTFKDMMTSSTFHGDNATALAEVERIATELTDAGFDVVRKKIETVPWHPAAPCRADSNPVMPKDCYFECHFQVVATDTTLPLLADLSQTYECKLSRNVFKRIDDEKFVIMTTYRKYDGVYEDFLDRVNRIQVEFKNAGFELSKEVIEFSIYDTKVSHDASWINS